MTALPKILLVNDEGRFLYYGPTRTGPSSA
jgi:hypothetical protein